MVMKVEHAQKIGRDYVLAGEAVFTIEIPDAHRAALEGRGHYTFKVVRKEADANYPEAYFVKLLVGPDNTRDYAYVGKLDPFTGQTTPTAKSKFKPDSAPVRLLNRLLARVWTGDHDAYRRHGFAVHHEGRCGRCGRPLTVPASVETGIGPDCAKLLKTW